MKQLWVLAAMAAVGLLVFSALAQDEGGNQERDRQARRDRMRQRMARFGARGRGSMVSLNVAGLQVVDDLSDDQKKKIADLRAALLAKIQELKKRMDEDVKRVLTPAQKDKMEAAQRAAALRGPGGVTLTPEQKAKLDAAREAAGKIEDRQARREFLQKATAEIRATYTEEQKKQEAERRNRFRRRRTPRAREGGGTTNE